MLRKNLLYVGVLLAVTLAIHDSVAATSAIVFPGPSWETRAPEAVGLDPALLDRFAEAIGGDGVLICDGYLVKTWGDPTRHGDWASSMKPVLSTLLFFAVEEGRVDGVDAPVRPWVQRRWPGKDLSEKDRGMTFRHLADMVSGYGCAEAPGTHWAYNDTGIALYVNLMVQVLGVTPNEAVLARLAPLQFQDGEIYGSRHGNGVNASPRDFARIGWFWLNKGRWGDIQVLPERYFTEYCRPDVPADLPRTKGESDEYLGIGTVGGGRDQSADGPGVYGFNWWFNAPVGEGGERFMPQLPADAFQANGHWGKECMLIIPSLRIVVAARGNWGGTRLDKTVLLMDALR